MAASGADNWRNELDRPSAAFFRAFAVLAREPDGAAAAVREAVQRLTPVVDWAAYLPHVPHGLLGLGAAFRLRPLLREASFLRLLATQLHAFAHESRSPEAKALGAIGRGSGNWDNLRMALGHHRPAIAWGEAAAVPEATGEHFRFLERAAEADMANVGHKPVLARGLGRLGRDLGPAPEPGRVLLALAAWQCASEPYDTFWHDRAARRLGEAAPVPQRAPALGAEAHRAQVREICDTGLVDLLDRFAARVRAGHGSGDLLAALALAAAERQLDARRDLEAKTTWNFVYLAALAQQAAEAGASAPTRWVQAAALVNLFPGGEEEDRPRPALPRQPVPDLEAGLVDAILDGEPLPAMGLAQALLARDGAEPVLRALAEAASGNDPAFNHSHQVLATAAAADLLPHLPGPAAEAVLVALAKALANAQGSSDLGRLADAALRQVGAGI
jgi:hypothetical protein